jgi:beta-galactosidase
MVKQFPEGFLWGTAISSFQAEMGRGKPSDKTDWWVWVHDPGNINEKIVSGDSPIDGPGFWELYKNDFHLLKEGLRNNAIRLSIDWGRIFPDSVDDIKVPVKIDEDGYIFDIEVSEAVLNEMDKRAVESNVKHYRMIFNEAKKQDITLMLTTYHWPLPLWLHDPIKCKTDIKNAEKKGWLDVKTVIEFTKFSAYIAYKFGDLVDLYCTINEPRIISEHGYLSPWSEFPPGLYEPDLYLKAMKNLAIAHGLSYTQIKKWDTTSFSHLGPCTVGIVPVLQAFEPHTPQDSRDVETSRLIEYAFNEWGLNAVFHGDYDMNLNYIIEPWEHKPQTVKGCDFLGVNYYSRWKIKFIEKSDKPLGNFKLMPCEGDCTDYGWEIYPEGLRQVLTWAYERYRRPIYITENGIADDKGDKRKRYLKSHIEKLHQTIFEDKVPVLGYFYWTLMDNFEWSDGYKIHFGLYRVNKETKERLPTETVELYKQISSSNSI